MCKAPPPRPGSRRWCASWRARRAARHRANAVAVGLTDTEMGRVAFAEWGPETTERVIRGIPLRRIGTPEEVARIVCFLAGPDAAYVTGKVLQVDGGQIIAAEPARGEGTAAWRRPSYRGGFMAFETRLTPAMAARWRGAGLWGDETLATCWPAGCARRPTARR